MDGRTTARLPPTPRRTAFRLSAGTSHFPTHTPRHEDGPSATEGRPSLREFAERFAGLIREAGGVPALYMVWPAESRSFDFPGVSSSYAAAAALVMYEQLTGEDARELVSDIPGFDGVSEADLATLRQAAHRANVDRRRATR